MTICSFPTFQLADTFSAKIPNGHITGRLDTRTLHCVIITDGLGNIIVPENTRIVAGENTDEALSILEHQGWEGLEPINEAAA